MPESTLAIDKEELNYWCTGNKSRATQLFVLLMSYTDDQHRVMGFPINTFAEILGRPKNLTFKPAPVEAHD